MSFAQGLSGLNAAANNLDVIGNNIANSSTVGFKSGGAQFATSTPARRVGLGTVGRRACSRTSRRASVQTSTPARRRDPNGDGFFRMASPNGEIAYTRNGQFTSDKDGFIVNSGGLRLTGYQVDATGTRRRRQPAAAADLDHGDGAEGHHQRRGGQFNLDARATGRPVAPFDPPTRPPTTTRTRSTVYDTLGNPHVLATLLREDRRQQLGRLRDAGRRGRARRCLPCRSRDAPRCAHLRRRRQHDVAGASSRPPWRSTNGAAPLNLTLDLTGTTQFGNVNDVASSPRTATPRAR